MITNARSICRAGVRVSRASVFVHFEEFAALDEHWRGILSSFGPLVLGRGLSFFPRIDHAPPTRRYAHARRGRFTTSVTVSITVLSSHSPRIPKVVFEVYAPDRPNALRTLLGIHRSWLVRLGRRLCSRKVFPGFRCGPLPGSRLFRRSRFRWGRFRRRLHGQHERRRGTYGDCENNGCKNQTFVHRNCPFISQASLSLERSSATAHRSPYRSIRRLQGVIR